MTRLPLAALAGAIALTAIFAAAPASAAAPAIPDGGSLKILTCDNSGPNALYDLGNAPTGTATKVSGSNAADPGRCGGQGFTDAATGTGYYISWDDPSGGPGFLGEVDPSTGRTSRVGPFVFPTSGSFDAYTLFQRAGMTYLIAYGPSDGEGDQYALYTVDLATAHATEVAPLSATSDLDPSDYYLWTAATDPSTGTAYLLTQDGTLFTLDTGTGVMTPVTSIDPNGPDETGGNFIYSMAIDASGVMYVLDYASLPTLFTTTVADPAGDLARLDVITDAATEQTLQSDGIFIVPGVKPAPAPAPSSAAPAPVTTPAAVATPKKPELASTGANAQETVLFASVGGGVLLVGAGLLIASRIRRRSQR